MSDEQQVSLNRLVLQTLESLQAAGVQQIPKPSEEALAAATQAAATRAIAAQPPTTQATTTQPTATAPKTQSPPASPLQRTGAPPPPPLPPNQAAPQTANISTASTLEVLQAEVAACTLCDDLATTRTQTVFGVGNPQARLCILGEAPGADEDRQGEPFVGRGGQLLNKILEACKMSREEVYILNILRCRPPDNRNPTGEEAQNCRRFLERQLQLVNPEFICCMGAVAAQNLLSTTVAIGRLRGKIHDYHGTKVVCTYHPAYLLRNPSAKKHTWDDMKMLMREMGTPLA